jgi:hypothetical protein
MNEEYAGLSVPIKDKLEIKIGKNTHTQDNYKKNGNSFTPSPGGKKPFINKFPLEDIAEFDEICQNSKYNKMSLTSKASKVKLMEVDSLSGKMPNFVRCYDDLIDLIKVDSKDKFKDERPERKQSEASKKNLKIVEEYVFNKEKRSLDEKSLEEQQIVKNLTNSEEIKDFYEYTEECLKRIATMVAPEYKKIDHLALDLPIEDLKTKKLAIFDLDETLVHCEIKKPHKGKVQINVKLPNGEIANVCIY